jgi:hypothetical protein
MIHFGHRGRENLASLTRTDFAVKQDSDGALYVIRQLMNRPKTIKWTIKNRQMDACMK